MCRQCMMGEVEDEEHFWGAQRPYIDFRNRFLYGFMFVYMYVYIYSGTCITLGT